MSNPERSNELDRALTKLTNLESRDERLANFLVGRLLQVEPEVPISEQVSKVAEGIDALRAKGGVVSGSMSGSREIFGRSSHIKDGYGRSFVVLEDIRPGGPLTVFYLSNSHAVWRANLSQALNGYVAKGMFGVENSADAPILLQQRLSKVAEEEAVQSNHVIDIIYAIHNDSNQPGGNGHADRTAENKMRLAGISTSPAYAAVDILADGSNELFAEGKAPDLATPSAEWESSHPTYGIVRSTTYPSVDDTLNYQINSTDHGSVTQSWVGTVEVSGSAVTSLALLADFAELPEEIMKPPVDYGKSYDSGYQPRREETSQFEQFLQHTELS